MGNPNRFIGWSAKEEAVAVERWLAFLRALLPDYAACRDVGRAWLQLLLDLEKADHDGSSEFAGTKSTPTPLRGEKDGAKNYIERCRLYAAGEDDPKDDSVWQLAEALRRVGHKWCAGALLLFAHSSLVRFVHVMALAHHHGIDPARIYKLVHAAADATRKSPADGSPQMRTLFLLPDDPFVHALESDDRWLAFHFAENAGDPLVVVRARAIFRRRTAMRDVWELSDFEHAAFAQAFCEAASCQGDLGNLDLDVAALAASISGPYERKIQIINEAFRGWRDDTSPTHPRLQRKWMAEERWVLENGYLDRLSDVAACHGFDMDFGMPT
jgi:hypothetical protein